MSLDTQFLTMLMMIAGGVYIGMALDSYREFEKLMKRRRLLTIMFEILFWILQGMILFYLLFIVNYGELRLYIFLAILCGFAAYQALLKEKYLFIFHKVIHFIQRCIQLCQKFIHFFIIQPVRTCYKIIKALVLWLISSILTLLYLVFKILIWPLRLIGSLLWALTPNKLKKSFHQFAGIYNKTKNIVYNWWTNRRNRR